MKTKSLITSQAAVDKATLPKDKNMLRLSVFNGDASGLYLVFRRTRTGSPTASFIYRHGGKDTTIGSRATWTLAAARARHLEMLMNVETGRDAAAPIKHLPATLDALFEIYIGDKNHAPKDNTATVYRYTWAKWSDKTGYGRTAIDQFTRPTAHDFLKQITNGGKDNFNSAKKCRDIMLGMRTYLETQFEVIPFETLLPLAKLFGKNNKAYADSKKPRANTLTVDQLRTLWAALCADPHRPAFLAMRWIICTATRKNETVGARLEELDGDTWHIPGERVKTGQPLDVPVCDAMRAVLADAAEVRGRSPMLFKVAGNTLNHALLPLRQLVGNDFTIHDLRRSASSLSAEHAGMNITEADLILNHIPKNVTGVTMTYQPDTLRRMVREQIGKYQDWLQSVLQE